MLPKCPHCNKELFCDNMDYERNDDAHVYQYWRGHCPDCSHNFRWVERYDFTNFCDLEEENELE